MFLRRDNSGENITHLSLAMQDYLMTCDVVRLQQLYCKKTAMNLHLRYINLRAGKERDKINIKYRNSSLNQQPSIYVELTTLITRSKKRKRRKEGLSGQPSIIANNCYLHRQQLAMCLPFLETPNRTGNGQISAGQPLSCQKIARYSIQK